MKSKKLLAGAAVAGLLTGASALASQAPAANTGATLSVGPGAALQTLTNQDQGKGAHSCKGKNSCKGQGGCKSGDHSCKGKNSCKGKGGCATDGSKPK